MSEKLTHWKKLKNPDYLGAYELEQGKDITVTIKDVKSEKVKGTDGSEKDCIIATFIEPVKSMIVNSTNAKMIKKLTGSPYTEKWVGQKIQLYIKKEKVFGDIDDVLRVRPFEPKPEKSEEIIKCESCSGQIKPYGKMSAAQLAEYTKEKYGKKLCSACAADAAKTGTEQPEPTQAETEETVNE